MQHASTHTLGRIIYTLLFILVVAVNFDVGAVVAVAAAVVVSVAVAGVVAVAVAVDIAVVAIADDVACFVFSMKLLL